MNLRSKPRLDYSKLHHTGERVEKFDHKVTTTGDKKLEDLKIREDIRHSIET